MFFSRNCLLLSHYWYMHFIVKLLVAFKFIQLQNEPCDVLWCIIQYLYVNIRCFISLEMIWALKATLYMSSFFTIDASSMYALTNIRCHKVFSTLRMFSKSFNFISICSFLTPGRCQRSQLRPIGAEIPLKRVPIVTKWMFYKCYSFFSLHFLKSF